MKADRILRGITWDHVRGYGPLLASIKPYEAQHQICIQWDKRSLKDFGDVSLAALASRYDLIIMDHPHVAIASQLNSILPLDEILPTEIIDDAKNCSVGPSFESYWWNNHLWALPIDAACQMASYRSDLISTTSIPRSWDEVFVLANQLQERKKFIGIALCPTDCNCTFLTLCAQLGDPFRENKSVRVDTAVKALHIMQRLFSVSHPASAQCNPIQLYDYMTSENDIVYCPLAFGYSNYSRPGFATTTLRFGSIPGQRSALLGGAGIAVSKKCERINDAATYASWLCSGLFQSTVYVEAGGQPAHYKAWLSGYVNDLTTNFFRDTLSTLEAAYVRPRQASWPLFQEECGEIIFEFLVKKGDISSAWAAIEACYRKHLA